jgi:hypothetical protein
MDLNCNNPLDPLDLEAFASGEPAPTPGAADHLQSCGACRERVEAFRQVDLWLADLPAEDAGPELGFRVDRLRAFSRAEKRSLGIWWPPAALFFGLLSASAALLSVPMLSGPEQAGLLSALPAALGLEWKTLLGFPGSIGRALPGSVSAISDLLALQRGYAALSILLLLPAGFSIARLWMRRAATR